MPMSEAATGLLLAESRVRTAGTKSSTPTPTAVSAAPTTSTLPSAASSTHTDATKGVSELCLDFPLLPASGIVATANPAGSHKTGNGGASDGSLLKFQGQKWTHIYDYERMLKQIRNCEKYHLRGGFLTDGGVSSQAFNGNGGADLPNFGSATSSLLSKSSSSPANASSASPSAVSSSTSSSSSSSSAAAGGAAQSKTTSASSCGPQLKQVQRLCGSEMHYYGIVPRQATLDVVICNHCRGLYTKIGFNNHMMLQHPALWSDVSAKAGSAGMAPATPLAGNEPIASLAAAYGLAVSHEHSQDGSGSVGAASSLPAELLGSPSDTLSGTMSTCSNGSSTSSSMSALATASGGAHARSKGSRSAAGGGGGGSKSRTKSKHRHHAAGAAAAATPLAPVAGNAAGSSSSGGGTHKSGKKSAAKDNMPTAPPPPPHTTGSGKPFSEAMKSLAAYASSSVSTSSSSSSSSSTSSNSSCSLPPTPRLLDATAAATAALTAAQSNAPTEAGGQQTAAAALLPADRKETVRAPSGSKKKALNSPAALGGYHGGHESRDSISSSSEASYKTAPNTSRDAHSVGSGGGGRGGTLSGTATTAACEAQLNELDRAVSSITGCDVSGSVSGLTPAEAVATVGDVTAAMGVVPVGVEEVPPQSAAGGDDPDSMFTFEDMLDSKFINEILNTADSDIQFDESALEAGAATTTNNNNGNGQTQSLYMAQQQQQEQDNNHPPTSKRMRYDGTGTGVEQNGLPAELAAMLQQQEQQAQQQQQQPQYQGYETAVGEDVKLFGVDPQQQAYQTQLAKLFPQEQIATIDAMQLQQLLYQQQQQATGGYDATAGGLLDPQQTDQASSEQFLEVKQFIDLCAAAESGVLGESRDGNKLAVEYARLASLGADAAAYEALAQEQQMAGGDAAALFNVNNVPSLTDDMGEEQAMMQETAGGMLLPSGLMLADPGGAGVGVGLGVDSQQYYALSPSGSQQQQRQQQQQQQQQQQLLAEFLTQAGYETGAVGQQTTSAAAAGGDTTGGVWQMAGGLDPVEDDGLSDFDFSRVETVKSTTGSKSAEAASSGASKYQDDFFLNVFIYAGMPRPLAMNSFGMVKLPQSTAVAFRKHVLTMRKANNSPITLGSGGVGVANLNGVVMGGNARLGKTMTAAGGGGGGGGGAGGGEQQQKGGLVNGTVAGGGNTGEAHGGGYSRARSKSGAAGMTSTAAATTTTSGGKNKTAAVAGVSAASSLRLAGGGRIGGTGATPMPAAATKTIFVNSPPMPALRCIRRPLIARVEPPKKNAANALLAKQIAEMLNAGAAAKTANKQPQQQQPQQQSTANAEGVGDGLSEQEQEQQQLRLSRVQHFYEHRRKLLSLQEQQQRQPARANKQQPHQSQRRPQEDAPAQQRLLKQQLLRTLTDCNNKNDAMRVFV